MPLSQRERNNLSGRAYREAPLLFVWIVLLAACGPIVPATTPPQLAFTPGPGVVITDRDYRTDLFTVRYPTGWRVVKLNETHVPPSVVFVAPDETASILLMTTPPEENSAQDEQVADTRTITLDNGVTVAAIGRSPEETWVVFLPVFERVVDSVRA